MCEAMTELQDTYQNNKLKIFHESSLCENKGFYIEIGDEANTREDLWYAKLLSPLLYLELINSAKIIALIRDNEDLKTKPSVIPVLQKRYLCSLINHFIEHNTINEEYFRAIGSLWDLYKADQSKDHVRDQALKTLLKVHIRNDFRYSGKLADEIETRVFDIVFDKQSGQLNVRQEFRTNENSGQLLMAQRWFLARYDVRNARIVSASIGKNKISRKEPISKELKITQWCFWAWMNAIILGMLAWVTQDPSLDIFKGKTALLTWIPPARKLILGLLLYGLPIVVIGWKVHKNRVWYQTLLPRLLCGVILGYLLLLNSEAWVASYINSEHGAYGVGIRSVIRIGLPLAMAFGYLYIEINNEIKGFEISSSFSTRRAVSIWLQGVFYALFIGLIFSDFFGEGILKCTDHFYFEGAIGRIYPFNVLFLFPLALFIGIFAQLIWEDKAITHPL